ncbi:MAG: hypothetical protein JWO36_2966 [Myxococcales bacterium]|nr:hypothetical protein [Myxococcales bacterium]
MRPRELRARGIALAGDLQRWLALAWDWFKPRTVPVIVAGIGMVFVLAATDYLAHAHGDDQPRNDVLVVHTR